MASGPEGWVAVGTWAPGPALLPLLCLPLPTLGLFLYIEKQNIDGCTADICNKVHCAKREKPDSKRLILYDSF